MPETSREGVADEATDRHGLEVLPVTQCLALLRSRPVGRIAYVEAGGPVIVPVNHLVDGNNVVIRSLSGSKLDSAVMNQDVAFELDHHDPARGTGWSVLVRGRATLVDEAEDAARYNQQLDSWAVEDPDRATFIRIIAEEITGRRLRAATD